MLIDYLNLFDVKRDHMELVMQENNTIDSMVNVMQDLHSRKQRVESGPYDSVSWSYLLWVNDFVGMFGSYPSVPMKDPYIKLVDDAFYCNPPMGTQGARRSEAGDNPYLMVSGFGEQLDSSPTCAKLVGKVMVAYNLFDFAKAWFSEYYETAWSDLEFSKDEVKGRCGTIGYNSSLSVDMFYTFLDDMNTVLGQKPRFEREEPEATVMRNGAEDVGVEPVKEAAPTARGKAKATEEGDSIWKYFAVGLGVVGIGVMVSD